MKPNNDEITISKNLLKYLMVTAAYNDLNGPTKEAYDMYDISIKFENEFSNKNQQ